LKCNTVDQTDIDDYKIRPKSVLIGLDLGPETMTSASALA